MRDRRYSLELTWDEIDALQGALRAQIYGYEQEHHDDPGVTAEYDQLLAWMWETIHRLGDARRVAHGYPAVLPS